MKYPEPKKTIVILGEDLSVKGGITSVLKAHLASSLKTNFHLHHIPTLVEGSPLQKLNIFAKAIFRLLGVLIFREADLVHIHSSSYASFYRKAILVMIAKIFRKPVIFHIHGSRFHHFFNNASPLIQKWISWTLNQVDQIIVLSQSWKKRVSKMTNNSNILVLNNPVDCTGLPTRSSSENNGEFTILFLGELCQRKGIFDLLNLAGDLCQEFPNLKFVLAGNGELEKVRQIVTAAALQERVLVPGWIQGAQRQKLLHQANLFILPSYDEGLPVALLEAMANGLPVISTYAGGIPELITENENGILVQPGDQKALKQAIQRMIRDEVFRKKISFANREKIEKEYDIKIISQQVRSLYLKLIP